MIDAILNQNKTKIVSPWFKRYKQTPEWEAIKGKFSDFANMTDNEIAYCEFHGVEPATCVCGNRATFGVFTTGYRQFCGAKCSNVSSLRADKIIATKIEKYGAGMVAISEKRKQSNLQKYGVENYVQSKEFAEKNATTLREKYGVDNVSQIDEVKQKKVGRCGNPEKLKETNKKKNESSDTYKKLTSYEWMTESYSKKTSVQISEDLGVAFSTVCNYLESHGIERNKWSRRSGVEQEVGDYIESLGLKMVRNDRSVLLPKELDVLVPEKKMAFEVNGIYWHSIKSMEEHTQEFINYHLDKSNMCESNGVQLLHIRDDEWNGKKEIWKSVIASKLGISNRIHGRKCEFSIVDKKTGDDFVNANHLQGAVRGGVYYGISYQGVLVSVIQIGKPRFSKYDHEIFRFCSLLNTTIVGGFSKLLSHAGLRGTVVSYANRSWSNGNLYSSNGFEFIGNTTPNYWYINLGNKDGGNRVKYQKHKLHKILDNYDPKKTETENMFLNGYIKYFDCGNKTFVKNFSDK